MACAGVAPASLSRRIQRHDLARIRKCAHVLSCSPSVIGGRRARFPSCRTAQIARARDYSKLTIVKLKDELRGRGLPLSGSKAVLVRRLQDNDAEDDETSPTAASSDSAQLFPNGGPMPDFSEVTKSELLQELRRRGDPILGRSKIDLYERLQQLILDNGALGGAPTPIADISGNPTFPVIDESTLSSDRAAAYKAARKVVMDPEFNPEATTAIELNAILQGLRLSSSGRKAELIFRVQQYIANERALQGDTASQQPTAGQAEGSTEEIAQVQAILEQMSDDEVAATLKSQGVIVNGGPRSMRERLELMLLVEARSERSGTEDDGLELLTEQARDEAMQLSRPQLEDELERRGEPAPPEATLSQLEDRLVEHLVRERSAAAAAEPAGAQEALASGDMPRFDIHSATHMLLTQPTPRLRVAVITGGPSAEDAVSLESARTVLDMLRTRPHPEQAAQLGMTLMQEGFEEVYDEFDKYGVSVDAYFVDARLQAWLVPAAALYSSTPADFTFKLPHIGLHLGGPEEMAAQIAATADIAFPAVHGAFGEDGRLFAALEDAGVEYVGSEPEAAATAFNKATARQRLLEAGFPALEQVTLIEEDFVDLQAATAKLTEEAQAKVDEWVEETGMDVEGNVVVVKPAEGGSSIGVMFSQGMEEALTAARDCLKGGSQMVVIEPKMLGAIEYTVSVVQSPEGCVVALAPTTLEVVDLNSDIEDHLNEVEVGQLEQQIGQAVETVSLFEDMDSRTTFFSYGRKYSPNEEIRTHTPPKLEARMVQAIRRSAERAFLDMGLRDYARFDGWLLIHAEAEHCGMLAKSVARFTDPAGIAIPPELPLPGDGPLPEDEFTVDGAIQPTDDDIARMGPEFEDDPVDEYVYDGDLDRYFTLDQLEYAANYEVEQAELRETEARAEVQRTGIPYVDPPVDAVAAARGDADAEFAPVTTPLDAVMKHPRELVKFEGGLVIISEVNPVSGLEQGSFLFQQAAALGWSHAAILRHIVAGALSRAGLPLLPAPEEPVARDPETLARGEEMPGDMLAVWTNTTEEAKLLDGEGAADDEAEVEDTRGAPLRIDAFDDYVEEFDEWADEHGEEIVREEGEGGEDEDVRAWAIKEGLEHAPEGGMDGFGALGMSAGDGRAQGMPELGMPALDEFGGGDMGWRGDARPAAAGEDVDLAEHGLAPDMHVARDRQKVYVLCGGESSERNVSLQGGITAWLHLRRYHDLEVTLYILAPQFSSLRERERRRDMLAERTHMMLAGLEEADLPEGMTLDEIRRPATEEPPPLEERVVWAVPHALALRRSVAEVVEACELLALTETTAPHARPPGAADGWRLREQMTWEMGVAGLHGAGSMFEGLGAPRSAAMDFEAFAFHAQTNSAVVFNMIHGSIGEDGTLQQYLQHFCIPFTGSGEAASRICSDKAETAEVIGGLGDGNIYPIPKIELFLADLAEVAQAPELAEVGLEGMRDDLVLHGDAPLLIKPALDGCSTGIMRLQHPGDLVAYATAIAQEWDEIPVELTPDGREPIPMPTSIISSFLVEPFVETDIVESETVKLADTAGASVLSATTALGEEDVELVEDGPPMGSDTEGSESDAAAEAEVRLPVEMAHNVQSDAFVTRLRRKHVSGLVEVTIGVYGTPGAMQAMQPSMQLKSGTTLSVSDKFQTGAAVCITPPPEELVPAASLQVAQESACSIANRLGLSGLARIDAFMAVADGTLFVIEINTIPGLVPNNVLFHQALAEDPPLYPDEFLRMQVLAALSDDRQTAVGSSGAGTHENLDGFFTGAESAGSGADVDGWAAVSEDEQIAEELLAEESLDWMKRV
eukprot:jgi/Ulvmu1/12278/UM087_0012.1